MYCLRTTRYPYLSRWDYWVLGPGCCEDISIFQKVLGIGELGLFCSRS